MHRVLPCPPCSSFLSMCEADWTLIRSLCGHNYCMNQPAPLRIQSKLAEQLDTAGHMLVEKGSAHRSPTTSSRCRPRSDSARPRAPTLAPPAAAPNGAAMRLGACKAGSPARLRAVADQGEKLGPGACFGCLGRPCG